MIGAAPELSRWVAQMPRIVTVKSVQIRSGIGQVGPESQEMGKSRDGAIKISINRAGDTDRGFGIGAAKPDAGRCRLEAARTRPRHRPAQDRPALHTAAAKGA